MNSKITQVTKIFSPVKDNLWNNASAPRKKVFKDQPIEVQEFLVSYIQ